VYFILTRPNVCVYGDGDGDDDDDDDDKKFCKRRR